MSSPSSAAPPSAEERVAAGPIHLRLALALLGFLPGFAVVDAFIAWWDREQAPQETGSWIADEKLGWLPRPHYENPKFQTRLDGLGMRNEPIPEDADPREVRILGVGASRLYGAAGALQTDVWNYQLQRSLAADPSIPVDVRVLNGSVMAYSEVQVCRRALRLMDEVEPDLVLIVCSPRAQMLLDPSVTRHWVRVGDELVQEDVLRGWPELLHPTVAGVHGLLSKSALYRRKRAQFTVTDDDRDTAIQRWMLSRAEPTPEVTEMLERTWAEMAALERIASERGIEVRLMLLAEQVMESDERWNDYCVSYGASGAPPVGTPRLEPLEVLEERCRELGFETWNFLPEIEAIGEARRLMLNDDQGHWSREGHEVIARGIERRLREEGLLQRLIERRAERPRAD